MQKSIKLETELWKCAGATLRVWLLLLELAGEYGNPLVLSFTEIAEYSNVCRRVSRRAVSKALIDLERLKMVKVNRRGNVSIITLNEC